MMVPQATCPYKHKQDISNTQRSATRYWNKWNTKIFYNCSCICKWKH